MKHKIFFTLGVLQVCLCIVLPSWAQTARITGVVIDAENKEPLIGASIYIEQLKRGEVTGQNGTFVLDKLAAGTYTTVISYMGYHSHTETVVLREGESRKLVVRLKEEAQSLGEVTVTAKGEARKLREQAMPIAVISMSQLQGTVNSVSDILTKTVGVTLRSSGGVGGASRISVRGLEGKRIGFFLDGTPMSDNTDFIDINDIPIDMIDRIEIYKGVVPAKFGGSAMGGAVNIVIREYPDRYADISHSFESFNTHKTQLVAKRHLKEKGLVFGMGGGHTYSDNDYVMESPYVKGLKIKRNHDRFQKWVVGGSVRARKWWFDEVEIEPIFIKTDRQIQGIETDIRSASIRSRIFGLASKLEKKDLFVEGLDFEMSTSVAYSIYNLIDTAKVWYDWQGNSYPTTSPYGGELGTRYASNSDDRKMVLLHKLNFEYLLHKQHSLNFNSFFTLANGYPKDELRTQSIGKQTVFDSRMRSWVSGLTYDLRSCDEKFLNSLTGRYYLYTMDTRQTEMYGYSVRPIHTVKSSFGINNALRYRFLPDLMGKFSAGYDVRLPSETELLGDGYFITPAESLLPERNTSVNIGLLYDLTGKKRSNLQVEVNAFYMYLKDMIRFTKGFLGAQYQNFGEMRTLGVETEIKLDILPCLYGYANATYQDLRDARRFEENSTVPNPTKGKRMPNIPYLLANAGLEFHKENLLGGRGQNTRIFADCSFIEEYLYDFEMTSNQRRIPRSTTIDLGFEHSFLNSRLFVSGKIKNLTDARVLSEFNRPLPGRSFGVKLRYIFK
ncbi:TonB-dependent receptor [Tannerella forsythia]|uniref:TonB-dependent receptor n=1 Tax=Tannerella forsythia TaxID=28112 RepID=A0A3P1XKZ2_TANFO|nr:TonB-dependent receptor [Tannerella forsythia]RRD59201.1 TonB-dependent receptor [Tannerella forsythia]